MLLYNPQITMFTSLTSSIANVIEPQLKHQVEHFHMYGNKLRTNFVLNILG